MRARSAAETLTWSDPPTRAGLGPSRAQAAEGAAMHTVISPRRFAVVALTAVVTVMLRGCLAASPDTNLNPAGQDVTLTGDGYPPNTKLYIAKCTGSDPYIYSAPRCFAPYESVSGTNLEEYPTVTTDATGRFTTTVRFRWLTRDEWAGYGIGGWAP